MQSKFEKLCDRLSYKGKGGNVAELFNSRNVKIEDKLRYLWGLAEFHEAYNTFPRVEDKKDEEKAKKYRLKGNELYAESNFSEALAQYTKCIIHSESNGSGNLALAYGNRSAILFELRQYKKCLRDINRAMNSGYPEGKLVKLTERHRKCVTALEKENSINDAMKNVKINDETPSEDLFPECCSNSSAEANNIQMILNAKEVTIPALAEANPKIPALTSAAEIGYSEEKGRGLYATRDIFPGEVLIRERSFASSVTSIEDACSNCLRPTLTAVPCPHCTKAIFCDEECLSEALNSFHSVECSLLKTLHSNDPSHYLLKVVLRAIVRVPFSTLKTQWASCEVEENTNQPCRMGLYSTINHLKTLIYEPEISFLLFDHSCRSLYMLKLFGLGGAYVAKTIIPTPVQVLKDDALLLAKVIFRHLSAASLNSISTLLVTYKQPGTAPEVREIGRNIYSIGTLMNHSCDPSAAMLNSYGSMLVVRALKFIPNGDEITVSYERTYAALDRPIRRSQLLKLFLFECRCHACENHWPIESELPLEWILVCPTCKINLNMEMGCPKCEINAFPLPSTDRGERLVTAKELNEIVYKGLNCQSLQKPLILLKNTDFNMICNAMTVLNIFTKSPSKVEVKLFSKLEHIFYRLGFHIHKS